MSVETLFNIIGSVSLFIIAVFLCVALYFLIKILKDISKVTHQFREKSEQFAGLITTLIAVIKKTFTERKKKKTKK